MFLEVIKACKVSGEWEWLERENRQHTSILRYLSQPLNFLRLIRALPPPPIHPLLSLFIPLLLLLLPVRDTLGLGKLLPLGRWLGLGQWFCSRQLCGRCGKLGHRSIFGGDHRKLEETGDECLDAISSGVEEVIFKVFTVRKKLPC